MKGLLLLLILLLIIVLTFGLEEPTPVSSEQGLTGEGTGGGGVGGPVPTG